MQYTAMRAPPEIVLVGQITTWVDWALIIVGGFSALSGVAATFALLLNLLDRRAATVPQVEAIVGEERAFSLINISRAYALDILICVEIRWLLCNGSTHLFPPPGKPIWHHYGHIRPGQEVAPDLIKKLLGYGFAEAFSSGFQPDLNLATSPAVHGLCEAVVRIKYYGPRRHGEQSKTYDVTFNYEGFARSGDRGVLFGELGAFIHYKVSPWSKAWQWLRRVTRRESAELVTE